MKIFLSPLILCSLICCGAKAVDPILVFSPLGISKWSGFADKNFEEIRVDSDGDGLTDFWMLRKDRLSVTINFVGQEIRDYSVKKFEGDFVTEIQYKNVQGRLVLQRSLKRLQKKFGFSESPAAQCNVNSSLKNLSDVEDFSSSVAKVLTKEVSKSLVDASCSQAFPRQGQRLEGAISNYLSGSTGQFDLKKCLKSEDFTKILEGKIENPRAFADRLRAAYALEIEKLSLQPENNSPLLVCKKSDPPDPKAKPFTYEDGRIVFVAGIVPPGNALYDQFRHEMYHRLKVEDEQEVHAIEEGCKAVLSGEFSAVSEKSVDSSSSKSTLSGESGSTAYSAAEKAKEAERSLSSAFSANTATKATEVKPQGLSKTASRSVASESSAAIPKELTTAQVGVTQLAQRSVDITPNRGSSIEDVRQTSYRSTSQILNTANSLVSSMNRAEASSAGTASARSPSRMVASTNSETKRANTANREPESAAKALEGSRNGLKPGERIVEEITLDGSPSNAQAQARNSARSGQARGNVGASAPAETLTARTTSGARGPANVSGGNENVPLEAGNIPGPRSAAGNGSSTGQGIRGSSIPAPRSTGSQTLATAGRRGPASSANTSKDELVTYFKSAPYYDVKRKLGESNFSKELADQNITIVNRAGESWGAPNGSTIFEDKGDRFVQQK